LAEVKVQITRAGLLSKVIPAFFVWWAMIAASAGTTETKQPLPGEWVYEKS